MNQKKFTTRIRYTFKHALGSILVALLIVSCGESSGSSSSSNSGAKPDSESGAGGSTSLVLTITAAPTRITSGSNIRLTARIQNKRDVTLDTATLRFFRSSDAAISDSDTSLDNISITNIAADASRDFEGDITGHNAGNMYYGACLLDISGNSATNSICTRGVAVEVIPVDLTIARFSATPMLTTSSADIRLTARIQNIGDATSTSASLRFYRSSNNTIDSNDQFLTAISLTNVTSDASRDFSKIVKGHSAGILYYGACLSDVSGEVATSNNCSSGIAIDVFPIVNVNNITDNTGDLHLSRVASVTTAQIGSATYLFVAGSNDNGVSVFEVTNDGILTNVDNITDNTGDLQLSGARSVHTAQIGSSTYLFVTGSDDNGVSVFEVSGDGMLTNVDNTTDNTGDLQLNVANSVATVQIGNTTYLFIAGQSDDGVSVFEVSGDGMLTNVDNITDNTGDLQLDEIFSIHIAQVGSNIYLFVAGFDDNGVSVFEISGDGMLTNVDNITDNTGDLQLGGITSITTAQIGSATYLFVVGNVDNGLSVFEVANNGRLTNVANIEDNAELNLENPLFVTTAQIGSATYLFVTAADDNGVVSIFEVANDGSLVNIANIQDNDTLHIQAAFGMTTAQIGSNTYLFVAGFLSAGLSVFRIDNNVLINSSSASGDLSSTVSSAVSNALNIRRGRSYAGNIAVGNSSGIASGTSFENSENHYRLYLPEGFFTFATKGNLDTFCTLSNAENSRLATDNDTGEGENCAITYNIRDAGYYLIKVSGHSAADIGNYVLTFP